MHLSSSLYQKSFNLYNERVYVCELNQFIVGFPYLPYKYSFSYLNKTSQNKNK